MKGFNRHHKYWPRRAYKSSAEKKFRNLKCNIEVLAVEDHRELHRATPPPPKPRHAAIMAELEKHRRGECPACQT